MDGIYVGHSRPATKKAVKEAVLADPGNVRIECTSMFGGYDGNVRDAPDGDYAFVGPCPHTSRKFYGTIKKHGGTVKVV